MIFIHLLIISNYHIIKLISIIFHYLWNIIHFLTIISLINLIIHLFLIFNFLLIKINYCTHLIFIIII